MASRTRTSSPADWRRLALLAVGVAVVTVALLLVIITFSPPDMGRDLLLLLLAPVAPGLLIALAAGLPGGRLLLSVVLTWILALGGEALLSRIGLGWLIGYGIGLAAGPLVALAVGGPPSATPTDRSDADHAGTNQP
jgi:hypothetical protein